MAVYYDSKVNKSPAFKFTENLIKNGFHRMKDFDIALHEIAWESGYDYEILVDAFNESDEPYLDRIISISDIALEHDL